MMRKYPGIRLLVWPRTRIAAGEDVQRNSTVKMVCVDAVQQTRSDCNLRQFLSNLVQS
jgi:hypothetical protein